MNKNVFQQFQDNLYAENLRGGYALEAMKFGIMSRTGLSETDALEVAVRIVLVGEPVTPSACTQTDTSLSGVKSNQRLDVGKS